MEGNAVQRPTFGVFVGFDLDTVGVVGANLVQGNDVRHNQAQQNQGHCDHMETKKPVQRGVAHHKIATNQQRQVGPDEGDGRKQVDDHLSTPVTHLPPRQQIAHESLSHENQKNTTAKQPDQLTRFAVAAVNQAAKHVHINHHKEGRGSSGMHVPDQPAPGHVSHDVLDRAKGQRRIGLVVHGQKYASDNLYHQDQHRQGAKDVEEVEVLRRVILTHVLFEELGCRKPVVNPIQQFVCNGRVWGNFVVLSHDGCP